LKKKKGKSITRIDRVLIDLIKIFKENPNSIYPTRSIKKIYTMYDESIIYHGLSRLVSQRSINIIILHNKRYYWLRRKERGE
jgi:hypothetical protein